MLLLPHKSSHETNKHQQRCRRVGHRNVWFGRIASICRIFLGRRAEHVALPLISDVNLFGNCECIIHFNAEVASRALDLPVTKKKLDGS